MQQHTIEKIQMRLTFTPGHRLFPELLEMNGDTHSMRLRVYELISRGLHEEIVDIGNAVGRTFESGPHQAGPDAAIIRTGETLASVDKPAAAKEQGKSVPSYEIGFLTESHSR